MILGATGVGDILRLVCGPSSWKDLLTDTAGRFDECIQGKNLTET